MNNIETEVRFLDIDVVNLKQQLLDLGATDHGDDLLQEIIFYDKDGAWQKTKNKVVRIRTAHGKHYLTYKHNVANHAQGTVEIQLVVDDREKTRAFLKEVGLTEFRHQEKRRHSFTLGAIHVDIDTWPNVPPYAEFEGPSEEALQDLTSKLDLEWSKADTHNAAWVLEHVYNIPVLQLKYFTFNHVE